MKLKHLFMEIDFSKACGVMITVILFLVSAPVLAQRTGTLLYDVDFGQPEDTPGMTVATHGVDAPLPRQSPTQAAWGDPTVSLNLGGLVDTVGQFGNGTIGSDEISFELKRSVSPFIPGFSYIPIWYETIHIEMDVVVNSLAQETFFYIILDVTPAFTHSVRFGPNGLIYVDGISCGSFVTGVSTFIEIDLPIGYGGSWTVKQDGGIIATNPISISELDGMRLQLYNSQDPNDAVAVDNIRICADGLCSPDPAIVDDPDSQTVCAGHPVSFSVTATGTPPLNYQWQRNGADMSGETGSSYTINSAGTTENGNDYRVRVWNAIDTEWSAVATLTVYDPVTVTIQPEAPAENPCSGSTLVLNAWGSGGGTVSFHWLLDGEVVSGSTSHTLIADPVTNDDAGVYEFVVSNECSSDTSNAVTIDVDSAPYFTLQPQSSEICVGDADTLFASATGDPAPTCQWYHDGDIMGGETDTCLIISNASSSSIGDYWVQASNHCGTPSSDTVHVNVLRNTVVVPDDYGTIQAAINNVCYHNGTVLVNDGVWSGTGNVNLSNPEGKIITIQSDSGDPANCVIDCGGTARAFYLHNGEGLDFQVVGFTVRNGNAGSGNGGGILCEGSSPSILDCIIRDCQAACGGGLAGAGFSGALINCTFAGNQADSLGGGMYLYQSSEPNPAANCTFYGNGALYGGGICLTNSVLNLDNSIVANSTIGVDINCQMSTANLSCCDMWGNAYGDYSVCIISQLGVNGNIHLDPMFIDAPAGDFTLYANSPCAPFSDPNPDCDLIGAWPATNLLQDDDDEFEYGVEYITAYLYSDDLVNTKTEADSLRSRLGGQGWTEGFFKSNGSTDWDHWADTHENEYVDDVDLAFFSGHGTESFDSYFVDWLWGPMFREDEFYNELTPGDCYDRYGEKDVEWIALSCCQALNNDSYKSWAATFNGAHLILGYKTNMKDNNSCRHWMSYMISDGSADPAQRVAWSWFKASDQNQSGKTARVIGESTAMKYDYLWGQASGPRPDPEDNTTFAKWTHKSGDASIPVPGMARYRSTRSMTLYDATPRLFTPVQIEELGAHLGIYSSVENYGQGTFHMATGSRYLMVSEGEGIDFGDTDLLWQPFENPPLLPTLSTATDSADALLGRMGLLPGAATVTAFVSDSQSVEDELSGQILSEYATDIVVSYRRNLGGFPVMGNGSTTLAYVSEGGLVSGLSQVWRDLVPGESVEIMDSLEVLGLLDTWGSRVAIGGIPQYETWQLNQMALGYYEEGFGVEQEQVFPIYLLDLGLYVGDSLRNSEIVYVPAAEQFIALIAALETPSDHSILVTGELAAFCGSGRFGSPPYSGYQWDSSLDGTFGALDSLSWDGLSPGDHDITFSVTDESGDLDQAHYIVKVTDQVDFGDAPDPGYPTLLASDGARHYTADGLCLGSLIDNETDGHPSAAANGDDLDNQADEDGVSWYSALAPGEIAHIAVTVSGSGYLSAWIDFNGDGDWIDTDEQVIVDEALTAGTDTLSFDVPSEALLDSTFARIRFSSQPGLTVTGMAPDGEVEDYRVLIQCEVSSPEGALPENEPCGQRLNNGCNLDPPVLWTLNLGDTWFGNCFADTGWRDTDWYTLTTDEPLRLTMTLKSELPVYFGTISFTVPGEPDCDDPNADLYPYALTEPCMEARLAVDLPVAGEYWLVIVPESFNGFSCADGPWNYTLHVDGMGLSPVVTITVDSSTVDLSWDAVLNATGYQVYSAGEPYADFPAEWTLETDPAITTTGWSEPLSVTRRFYRVVAISPLLREQRLQQPRLWLYDQKRLQP